MKKVIISLVLFVTIFAAFSIISNVYADNTNSVLNTDTGNQLIQIKDKENKELADYVEVYGSESYGFAAYILGKIRIYSIPLCFLGIAVGAIYQYVIGIRKLDVRDRGMNLVVMFVTLLLICQVLPLIFTVVVKGWRN